MNIIRHSVWVVGLLFLLSSCALHVGAINPVPNVDMDESDKTLSITFDPAVQDVFEVPGSQGMKGTKVENWHGSLTAALTNGFGPYLKIVPSGGDYTIRIKRAEVEFAPSAVTGTGAAVAAHAQVTYQARLLDAKGETLARSGGTVTAKKAIMGAFDTNDNAAEAVASMVEKMAEDFFEGGRLPEPKADEDEEKADDDEEKKDDEAKADEEKADDEDKKDEDKKDEDKKDEGDAK